MPFVLELFVYRTSTLFVFTYHFHLTRCFLTPTLDFPTFPKMTLIEDFYYYVLLFSFILFVNSSINSHLKRLFQNLFLPTAITF